MFELLLQADRAMADGLLDEAELIYWQLIELDPTNAIAIGGLARVFLERGDERLARNFADQALAFDPNCVLARRVLETLQHRAPEPAGPEPPEMPLIAVERLEILGRRRRTERRSTNQPAQAGAEEEEAAEAAQTGPETDGRSRGRTGPDQVGPPSAAARQPLHPRREPHHAMPIGRRLFDPDQFKAEPPDAFAEAEMAAAVEAVDAVDDAGPNEATGAPETAPAEGSEAGRRKGVPRDLEAAEADETVALRIAPMPDADEAEAAEAEALREAVAIVLGEDGQAAAAEVFAPASGAAEERDHPAPEPLAEPPSIEEPPVEAEAGAVDAHASAAAPSRKRGWFHRFRRS
jgi:tetratricopeptide (TPR) repeat protein